MCLSRTHARAERMMRKVICTQHVNDNLKRHGDEGCSGHKGDGGHSEPSETKCQ